MIILLCHSTVQCEHTYGTVLIQRLYEADQLTWRIQLSQCSQRTQRTESHFFGNGHAFQRISNLAFIQLAVSDQHFSPAKFSFNGAQLCCYLTGLNKYDENQFTGKSNFGAFLYPLHHLQSLCSGIPSNKKLRKKN